MTGSKAQWYNGMMLLVTFFSCRLVWGTFQSICIFVDIFRAFFQSSGSGGLLESFDVRAEIFKERNSVLCLDQACAEANAQVTKFANHNIDGVPFWLVVTYLGSNFILNSLNFYWFSKMIETVLKRFRKPADAKEKPLTTSKSNEPNNHDVVLDAAATLEEEESVFINGGTNTPKGERVAATAPSKTATNAPRRRKA